jgi:hypothetical protein
MCAGGACVPTSLHIRVVAYTNYASKRVTILRSPLLTVKRQFRIRISVLDYVGYIASCRVLHVYFAKRIKFAEAPVLGLFDSIIASSKYNGENGRISRSIR